MVVDQPTSSNERTYLHELDHGEHVPPVLKRVRDLLRILIKCLNDPEDLTSHGLAIRGERI